MATWPADSISSGFVYVTDVAPENPAEGETWYDLGTNEAKVYDGVEWHLLTVTDHSEVGGVSAGQHRSDANIRSVVDGQVDAETVDGLDASELSATLTEVSGSASGNLSAYDDESDSASGQLLTASEVTLPVYFRVNASHEVTGGDESANTVYTRAYFYAEYAGGGEDHLTTLGVTSDSFGTHSNTATESFYDTNWPITQVVESIRVEYTFSHENAGGGQFDDTSGTNYSDHGVTAYAVFL